MSKTILEKKQNPFSVRNINGVPRLLKNGTPVFPLMFWQWTIEEDDAKNAHKTGVDIFTCFGSSFFRDHHYWIGEKQYDFDPLDQKISEFFRLRPESYLIPRIFVTAPQWWLEKHPEEQVQFSDSSSQNSKNNHESFASELWKREQGEALRVLLRHFRSMPWSDRIIGIHIAGGPCGEWHWWYDGQTPDYSLPMVVRYGKTIPPPMERDAAYYQTFYSSAVDAIEHFCRIVKEESDWLTVVFYGYFLSYNNPNSHHRALHQLLELDCVDILAAPHTYSRRRPGEDAYFRSFPATVAKHGKLLFDESDDRTPLGKRTYASGGRIIADTPHDAIRMLRREFGNAITHCIGLWYMDIDPGMFRAPDYWAEIERACYWGNRSLTLPCRRVSEIAVLCDETGQYHLPAKHIFNNKNIEVLRERQFSEFCKIGSPFDFYTTDDVDAKTLSQYRIIVLLDGVAVSDRVRKELRALRGDNRAFIWFYGAGAFCYKSGKYTAEAMSELTGLHFELAPRQPMPYRTSFDNWEMGESEPGFLPWESMGDFGTWSSWYFGLPNVLATKLREIAHRCGVFLYSESNDVLSVSESALMLHCSSSGEKTIRLPSPKIVTDMISGIQIGNNIREFRFHANAGDTALFELA